MGIEIKALRRQDETKAMEFAIEGMHFNWFMSNKVLLKLYGRYFWYMESAKATQIIAAYDGEEFLGVLLAEIYGEDKIPTTFWRKVYINVIEWVQSTFIKGGVETYDVTNQKLLERYQKQAHVEGEIVFLAADPKAKVKGIGSALLAELEKRERGKRVYLFTDDGCTYQFYEHRGFEKVGDETVYLEFGNHSRYLRCLLYSKVLGQE